MVCVVSVLCVCVCGVLATCSSPPPWLLHPPRALRPSRPAVQPSRLPTLLLARRLSCLHAPVRVSSLPPSTRPSRTQSPSCVPRARVPQRPHAQRAACALTGSERGASFLQGGGTCFDTQCHRLTGLATHSSPNRRRRAASSHPSIPPSAEAAAAPYADCRSPPQPSPTPTPLHTNAPLGAGGGGGGGGREPHRRARGGASCAARAWAAGSL